MQDSIGRNTRRNKDFKTSLIYLVPTVVSNLLPILVLPFLTKELNPTQFGLIALAQVFGSFIFGVSSFGLPLAYERNYFKYKHSETLSASLLLSCLISVLTMGILFIALSYMTAELINRLLLKNVLTSTLMILAASIAVLRGANQLLYTFLRNSQKPKAFANFSLFEGVSSFILIIVLVLFYKLEVTGYFYGQLLGFFLTFSVTTFYIFSKVPASFDLSLLKEALNLGYPLTLRVFLNIMNTQLDKYILSLMSALGQVGLYSVAQRIAQVVFIFTTSLDYVFIPHVYSLMFESKDKNPEPYYYEIGRYLTPYFYITCGLGLLIGISARELLYLFAEPDYSSAASIITILCAYYVILFFGKVNGRQMMYAEKSFLSPILSTFSLIVNILVFIPLVKWIGALGAALGMLIAGFISSYAMFYVSQKCFPIKWESQKIWIILIFMLSSLGLISITQELNLDYKLQIFLKAIVLSLYLFIGKFYGYLNNELLKVISQIFQRNRVT